MYYEFTILGTTTQRLILQEVTNSCISGGGTNCSATATLANALPSTTGWDFLGWALQKFEIGTTGGNYVVLNTLGVDASAVLNGVPPTSKRQPLSCDFVGSVDTKSQPEPMACATRSVGIAVDTAGWYETQPLYKARDQTLLFPHSDMMDWFSPYAPAGNVRGLFAGLNAFVLGSWNNPPDLYPVRSVGAGCFGVGWNGSQGQAQWYGAMSRDFKGFSDDGYAYVHCLMGWMQVP